MKLPNPILVLVMGDLNARKQQFRIAQNVATLFAQIICESAKAAEISSVTLRWREGVTDRMNARLRICTYNLGNSLFNGQVGVTASHGTLLHCR
jgi:hypothetical protein